MSAPCSAAAHLIFIRLHHVSFAHVSLWVQRLPRHAIALDVGPKAILALFVFFLFPAATGVYAVILHTHSGKFCDKGLAESWCGQDWKSVVCLCGWSLSWIGSKYQVTWVPGSGMDVDLGWRLGSGTDKPLFLIYQCRRQGSRLPKLRIAPGETHSRCQHDLWKDPCPIEPVGRSLKEAGGWATPVPVPSRMHGLLRHALLGCRSFRTAEKWAWPPPTYVVNWPSQHGR